MIAVVVLDRIGSNVGQSAMTRESLGNEDRNVNVNENVTKQ